MNLKKQSDIQIEERNGINLYGGVAIKKLKARKQKQEKIDGRRSIPNCPNCLSSLIVGENNKYSCSGDRLKIWEKEFHNYLKLNDKDKVRYLMAFSHPDRFEELFERWDYKDSEGNRTNFDCGYSNTIHSLVNPLRIMIADPLVCKRIEKSLGRQLTEAEKYGEQDIFRFGNSYFEDFKKGRVKVKITLIFFPDGC